MNNSLTTLVLVVSLLDQSSSLKWLGWLCGDWVQHSIAFALEGWEELAFVIGVAWLAHHYFLRFFSDDALPQSQHQWTLFAYEFHDFMLCDSVALSSFLFSMQDTTAFCKQTTILVVTKRVYHGAVNTVCLAELSLS